MKNKALLITLLLLLVVLGVAGVLYPRLSAGQQTQQLVTTATVPAETTAPTEAAETEPATEVAEATEATEPTEPRVVPAPDFTVLDWDGNPVNLSDYFGKPIVLNFWAHWCGPCQMEMPEFHTVWEELEGEVTFLMVHVGEEVEQGKEKVTQGGYTFPVVFDDTSAVAGMYGINAFPTTLFLSREGTIEGYYIGAMDRDTLLYGIDLINTAE